MNKGDRMSKEKRNITTKLETESKYLSNVLDKEDVKHFKKLIPELQDTWMKKQMFRTETEMRFSVLSDNKYPTSAAVFEPAPRSTNVAPREKKPLGIAIAPDITPENIDSSVPTLSAPELLKPLAIFSNSVAIYLSHHYFMGLILSFYKFNYWTSFFIYSCS